MNVQPINNQQNFRAHITGTGIMKPVQTSTRFDKAFPKQISSLQDVIASKGKSNASGILKEITESLVSELNRKINFDIATFRLNKESNKVFTLADEANMFEIDLTK